MADAQTTIADKIADIKTDRAKIRNHMKDNWGVATDTDKLKELATKITAIEKKTVAQELPEGTGKYYIPKGYHDGTGWVEAVNNAELDAQEYKLEEGRKVTPTTEDQVISKSEGFYGLGAVTVNKIPTQYKDTTDVTATQAEVLAGKLFVDGTGLKTGTMPNRGKVTKTLDTETTSYTILKGYHDGTGTVSIECEAKSVTPKKAVQTVYPSTGKVLGTVTVNSIPEAYILTENATATAADIMQDKTAYVNGEKITGTIKRKGTLTKVLHSKNTPVTISEGYYSGGTVSIDFEEEKTIIPSKGIQAAQPAEGKVLSTVYVAPIPAKYVDATDATATAAHVLEGETAYSCETDESGNKISKKITGTMTDNGTIGKMLKTTTPAYTMRGYYGGGQVSVAHTTKVVTPSKSQQTIEEASGAFYSKVTVNAIPSAYQDVSGVTATADKVLTGVAFVTKGGVVTGGSMPNNGAVAASINALTGTSYTIAKGYHDGSGTVTLTEDLYNALAEI